MAQTSRGGGGGGGGGTGTATVENQVELLARIGEKTATPDAESVLGRLKSDVDGQADLLTRVGTVGASPPANTILDRLKSSVDQLVLAVAALQALQNVAEDTDPTPVVLDATDTAIGAPANAAVADDTASGSVIAVLKAILRDLRARLGSLTESAPASDTASSGNNGRLQRVAQNITTLIGAVAGATYTDTALANATGSSQQLIASSATRNYLMIANPSSVSWWINPSGGTAAPNTTGSFELLPSGAWEPRIAPRNAVTGIATANTDLTIVSA